MLDTLKDLVLLNLAILVGTFLIVGFWVGSASLYLHLKLKYISYTLKKINKENGWE
jgi:hypothetical protein